jgi:hypothetical protein
MSTRVTLILTIALLVIGLVGLLMVGSLFLSRSSTSVPSMPGSGMMGGMGAMMGGPYSAVAQPITMGDAVRLAEQQVGSYGNPELAFDEVEGFAYNFYIPVYETSTGQYAFEVIIDRYSGVVMPEPGPNMMWNARYGMMGSGGMMGRSSRGQREAPAETPITAARAKELAQQFLGRFLPGATTGEVHTFYGYYTIHVERNGRMQGMLSVHGGTGAVWYHAWHGDFLEAWERSSR